MGLKHAGLKHTSLKHTSLKYSRAVCCIWVLGMVQEAVGQELLAEQPAEAPAEQPSKPRRKRAKAKPKAPAIEVLSGEAIEAEAEEGPLGVVEAELPSELPSEVPPMEPSVEPPADAPLAEAAEAADPEEAAVIERAEIEAFAQLAQHKPGTSGWRMASYVLSSTAVATAATGTVFALLANHQHSIFKNNYTTGEGHMVHGQANLAKAHALMQKTRTYKTVAIASFSVAGASAIGGILSFFLSPEYKSKTSLGFIPIQGGALLSINGKLP